MVRATEQVRLRALISFYDVSRKQIARSQIYRPKMLEFCGCVKFYNINYFVT